MEESLRSHGSPGLPDAAQTLLEALEWHCARHPDRLHILLRREDGHGEHPIRYRDLLDAAQRIALGLAARGLRPRQTVALMLPTGEDYPACVLGIMIAGGIPAPLEPPLEAPPGRARIEDHLRRHARILSNARAAILITTAQAKPIAVMLQAAVPSLSLIAAPSELSIAPATRPLPDYQAQAGDIAILQYTSGSTGDPKGVMLTHANLLANIRALGNAVRVKHDDVFVSWLPLWQDMGLIGAWLFSLYHGIALMLMPPSVFFARPSLWLQEISRHRGTLSAAPDSAYRLCLRQEIDVSELDLSCWRLALNGGDLVNPATLESFAVRFAPCGLQRKVLTPVYGLAECCVGLAFPPLERGPRIDRIRRGPFFHEGKAIPADGGDADLLSVTACGRPLPGHEMRVVDETGYEQPDRQIGNLEFRGPSATAGYYRNPEASARLFHGGWLDSGDQAYMAEGEAFVTGRVKELIKRADRKLYPYDLEEAVGNLKGIRRGCVAVFSARDNAGGERLVIIAETEEPNHAGGAYAGRAALCRNIDRAVAAIAGAPADDIVLVRPHAVLKTLGGRIHRVATREAYERGELEQYAASPGLHQARFLARMLMAHTKVGARRMSAWLYGCYIWILFALLLLFCGGTVMMMRRPSPARLIASLGARLFFRLAGVPLSAQGLGRLPSRPHALLVNHTSFLDAVVLTALLPPHPGYGFVVRQEFAIQRLLCPLLRSLGAIVMLPSDSGHGTSNVKRMAIALKRRKNLVVFPEGGFSRSTGLKPFHSGAFAAAANAGVPIAVAGLRGTRVALRPRTWLPRRVPITLEIGPVLIPDGNDSAELERLSAAARKAMASLSGEFDSLA